MKDAIKSELCSLSYITVDKVAIFNTVTDALSGVW